MRAGRHYVPRLNPESPSKRPCRRFSDTIGVITPNSKPSGALSPVLVCPLHPDRNDRPHENSIAAQKPGNHRDTPSAGADYHGLRSAGTPMRKLLLTGIRNSGDTRFHLKILGYPGSDFPPVSLNLTLRELAKWFQHAGSRRRNSSAVIRPQPAALTTILS